MFLTHPGNKFPQRSLHESKQSVKNWDRQYFSHSLFHLDPKPTDFQLSVQMKYILSKQTSYGLERNKIGCNKVNMKVDFKDGRRFAASEEDDVES